MLLLYLYTNYSLSLKKKKKQVKKKIVGIRKNCNICYNIDFIMNKNCLYIHLLYDNLGPPDQDFREKYLGSPP